MTKRAFDHTGLSCPIPLLKLSVSLMRHEIAHGDIIEVTADCPSFSEGVKHWCEQTKSVLLGLRPLGSAQLATIRVTGR